jgi:hypothetical protein
MKYRYLKIGIVLLLISGVLVYYGIYGSKKEWPRDSQPIATTADTPSLIFLSDSDPGYKLLEDLQELAYKDNPRAFRWRGDAEQLKKIAGLLDELAKRPRLFNDKSGVQVDTEKVYKDVTGCKFF